MIPSVYPWRGRQPQERKGDSQPNTFVLYHINGIGGTPRAKPGSDRGIANPDLLNPTKTTTVIVRPVEVVMADHDIAPNLAPGTLREIILTRFGSASVEYLAGEPRIY